ncbi:Bax inhibitor-1/YccA family protein [Ferrovum myxofaciens]|jgi:FtsH-binding integral membrane protein|uniref:Bax inhibitor-1/YccA family protein n=2 Tax=root TaxID=1 RepID=A0A9E6SX25_9PROT|nr:Bax inhibitor-1/YccA family protein [Ferrovum myxofaciens]MBW8028462.1 BAX inhibitor (BI)-1/YccA family protein [Ferrovum sp.]MBU6995171.1 Bax inhibitor-1/YccA family protein [Ferrovum myxofaciens]QKE38951.1 MAG: Bax inhibitor-1/YccA family protein [Ferrovum myxofaciens]QKE41545.1 MAG: Bax inhibitor-1/YccA family protein [Ferrovum myxofaciens]QWY74161.1 MAG: Bax inhibitor-1/YccA family protein [Ferrovum myxofaciens]
MQREYNIYNQAGQLDSLQHRVLRNTYWLLGLSLIPTAVGALVGLNLSFAFMAASPMLTSLLFLGAIYGLFYAIEANRYSSVGVYLLLLLTFVMGVMLGPLLQFTLAFRNGAQLVSLAAGGTAAVFFTLSAVASTTKRNFTGMAQFLAVGAVVLMVAVIANIFLHLPLFQVVLCGAFMIFSSLMILFNISAIVHGGETNYITATLSLYVNIYNIFVSLLQLLGIFGGDRR